MSSLKNYRINKKLTQAELAGLLNVSQSCLSDYERLKKSPCKETALRISAITGIPAFDLLFDKAKRKVFSA